MTMRQEYKLVALEALLKNKRYSNEEEAFLVKMSGKIADMCIAEDEGKDVEVEPSLEEEEQA